MKMGTHTLVERSIQSNCNEGCGPHAVSRIHQKAAADARDTVSDEVRSKCNQYLIQEVSSVPLVEVLGKIL